MVRGGISFPTIQPVVAFVEVHLGEEAANLILQLGSMSGALEEESACGVAVHRRVAEGAR